MSIYEHGTREVEDNCEDIRDIELDFNDLYLEYDDIEYLENDIEFEDIEDDNLLDVTITETTLTPQKIDMISVKLGASWKRFARISGSLSEAEIENIEYSYSSMYEKCYQMMIIWERKSKGPITFSMVTDILFFIQRNDLVRDLTEDLIPSPTSGNTYASQLMVDGICNQLSYSWKEYARETSMFSEVEIMSIDEEESNMYEKCYKMLTRWQEKSIFPVTPEDMKSTLWKVQKGMDEKVIRYTVDNGSDIRKIKVRLHHGLQDLTKELINIDKNLSLLKVQYIESQCEGDVVITCDNESHLDLAIFDENVTDFNVVTKRKRWILFPQNVRTIL